MVRMIGIFRGPYVTGKQKTNTFLMNTEHGYIDLETRDINVIPLQETQSIQHQQIE